MLKDEQERAINIIQSLHTLYTNKVYVGFSGGKDSAVVMHLTFKAIGANVPIVINAFNDTDFWKNVPWLLTHPYEKYTFPVIVTNPPKRLGLDTVKRLGLTCQIDGTRIAEATRTDGKSTTFVKDGKNVQRTQLTQIVPNGLGGQTMLYPIYDWSDDDVFAYIRENKLNYID